MKIVSFLIITFVLIGCASETKEAAISLGQSKPKLKEGNYNVAFLITDGTYNTEFTAPWDIYDHVRFRKVEKGMNLFTVSNTNDTITTFEGLKITPDYNFLRIRFHILISS